MSIGVKIRILLVVLSVCCIVTAITLKHTVSENDYLRHQAATLQDNLAKNEELVFSLLNNPQEVEKLKNIHEKPDLALAFIDTYPVEEINVITYKGYEVKFWSSYLINPPPVNFVKDGVSVVQLSNGWYEAIKKTEGDFAVVFYIKIKSQFLIENNFLNNEISKKLLPSNTLTFASFIDNDVVTIKSTTGKPLFEVKLRSENPSNHYSSLEIWLWVVGILSFSLFVNSLCSLIAKNGRLALATLLLFSYFLVLRLTDLQYGWLNHQFNLAIFSPAVYGQSFFLPSLGDLLLNVICATWVLFFIYTYKEKYSFPDWLTQNKTAGLVVHTLMLVVLSLMAFHIDRLFSGLVYNSKINFDITNIINLGWASWISIGILCLVWFNVFLLAYIFMQWTKKLNVTNKERLLLFLSAFLGYLIFRIITEFTVFFIVYALFLFVLGWNIYVEKAKFSIRTYVTLFFCLALISSIKYVKYQDIKERNKRLTIAQKLLSTDNPRVISSIESLEKGVSSDEYVLNFFKAPDVEKEAVLESMVDKKYLDSYLAQYEYNLLPYSVTASSYENGDASPLQHYKELVQSGSVKVSNYFYRLNDTFGYQSYFGIIPIFDNKQMVGTLVLELRSQQYNYNNQFPELLVDGKVKSEEDFKDYSFAFYNYGSLINQAGKFTYQLSDGDYNSRNDEVFYINDDETGYNHMVYKPTYTRTIVISKEKTSYVSRLSILSFFFLVFILFSVGLHSLLWLSKNIDDKWGGWFNINRSLMINANKILYKTRIQFSIVLSVVATLLIVGWTTFFYISSEYRRQQDDFIRDKLRKVQLLYGKKVYASGSLPTVTDLSIQEFNQFSDVNSTYLNLFDTNGNLVYTSIPKIYEYGILSKNMAPDAYIYLNKFQRAEYISPNQKIGDFTYSAAYGAVRNSQNQTIGYIGLPYYGNEGDFQSKIGLFINTLINIYALVFVAIGVLAVFLANQITNPLTFIQESIRKTKLGQKNQPIVWSRHDEIGSLIKEYNKMLAALEDSAVRLAKSERESAWREMAKQVAHEIKNPLTPLKLGVQLLEKSWKEKDPNFERKFERFNKSFVEQIDSLATIASEFSNFAKMPDTKLQRLQLLPILQQASDIFVNTNGVEIHLVDQTTMAIFVMGDKDQLLRTFNNLLKNAIEAASNMEACVIYIKLRNDHKMVWIEVSDNGKGIDFYLQDKIFAPNFTTKSSGTGLGLAFVKQAVENAGGTVAFKSVLDKGTTFYLSFPLA
ncbi:ATP-binding protein [Pedobacter sp.]|uniref:sensor histidine kinase n=1 Tax=Pedobacter sp. TaxID=1411316 RepID=UPI003D7F86EC